MITDIFYKKKKLSRHRRFTLGLHKRELSISERVSTSDDNDV